MVAHTRVPRSSLVQQAFEKGALQSVSQQRPTDKQEETPFVPSEAELKPKPIMLAGSTRRKNRRGAG
jgi:hypothetical protein